MGDVGFSSDDDLTDHNSPVALRDFPPGCVSMPRRAPKNPTRPGSVPGRGEANDWEGECSHLTLPEDFAILSPRDQFLHRRKLYRLLMAHFLREKARGDLLLTRPDLQVMKLMNEKKFGLDYQELGPVPGVRVEDEFEYRSEMFVVGLHRQVQSGIAWIELEGEKVASSVVFSGGYSDDNDGKDTILYTGQGGQLYKSGKRQVKDQLLGVANKSLIVSHRRGTPVRFIRGRDADSTGSNKIYTYDGLFRVSTVLTKRGKDKHLIYQFQLDRIRDLPAVAA